MQQTVNLTAGQKQRVGISGSYLLLMDIGAASSVEVWVMRGTEEVEYIRTARRGTKMRMPAGNFTHVDLRASVDAACEIVISDGMVDIDLFDGASILAEIVNTPLPVSNDRGSPGNLLHVSGVSVADTPATSVTAGAAVAVTDAGAVLAAANVNRRELRFFNQGPDPAAIGPAGATWAQRALVIYAGDTHYETRGANLAWSAITDTGETASVGVQGVLT
jgi:hypothetical protein